MWGTLMHVCPKEKGKMDAYHDKMGVERLRFLPLFVSLTALAPIVVLSRGPAEYWIQYWNA